MASLHMPITLIDWLYIDDFVLPSTSHTNMTSSSYIDSPNPTFSTEQSSVRLLDKQGALIVYPRMIDRWNVASLIVSKWEDHKVVVVTDHPNEFMNTIINASGTIWTDLELIPFPLLKYSDLAEIRRALQNTEVDIILFDDARMLAMITPALQLSQIYPKIIVLTTWGDSMDHLNIVTNKFPELRLLALDIISDNANIDWKVTRVPMSDRQLKYYDQVRAREITEASDHTINYPISRMLTLYSYPDNIMADTLSHKYICETDQSTFPDTLDTVSSPSSIARQSPSGSTWLNSSYISTLSNDGPKLLSVIDGIISNWPAKQIILTRFNHRYGVDLITSFLKLMTQNKQNPYELTDIFHTSCTDEYETSINTFHRFNNSNSGILMTNIMPLIPLKGVSVIHVVDSYSFLYLQTVLDRIHKRYLNTPTHLANYGSLNSNIESKKDIIIYCHLASHPKEKSSDEVLYERLLTHIVEANRIYSGLISMSAKILFDPTLGLIVK